MKLNELLQSDHFEEKEEICPGCQNHCQVHVYSFANGRQYVAGSNCERVYSSAGTTAHKGINTSEEKYNLLFNRTSSIVKSSITIGLPRGLGIYENYPFWQTLDVTPKSWTDY